MRTLKHYFFTAALLGLFFTACKEQKAEDKTGESAAQDSMEVTETEATASTAVLNVNLATEADLEAAGLSADLIAGIMEKKPLLSMNELDQMLGDEVNKEELYKKMFIPLNLNTTAEADFKMIPGVGDRMAHEFEEYRPYTSVAQFKREIGKYVDEEEVARYLNYVYVPVELNTASEEDIKALPGVGDRMAHEFEEYRPYKNMEQFRAEIGKYVDEKELARLEKLVYLKE
ncbi:helix-hairpin-helix domain-containing protein [Zeaxanthinibacter sp. PT1]|uniref:helix-hairpin-helix domain-containing protein n=1 Tax=Zeaxanthinibacter TaxID=561554 RepID=UPI002349E541|nr:helix-hairpin-helix domain-containing protein [Zeaxanthinibacter sp. PT1]MDC6350449.1 helix-hairpin-helix domain-containing protein [Zeaxanthinibacter sp. PT1]